MMKKVSINQNHLTNKIMQATPPIAIMIIMIIIKKTAENVQNKQRQ